MTCTKSGRRHFKLSPGCQKKHREAEKFKDCVISHGGNGKATDPRFSFVLKRWNFSLMPQKEVIISKWPWKVEPYLFLRYDSYDSFHSDFGIPTGGMFLSFFFKLNFLEVTLWVSNRVYRLLEDFITTSWFCRYSFGDSQGPVLHLFLIHWLKIFAYWQQVRRFTKMWLEKPWPQIFGWGFIR